MFYFLYSYISVNVLFPIFSCYSAQDLSVCHSSSLCLALFDMTLGQNIFSYAVFYGKFLEIPSRKLP